MRFRAGLIVGVAIGYVLGARAGRERYEQIQRLYGRAQEHPAVRQLVDQATAVVDLGRTAVAESLATGSKGLRRTATQRHTA